MKARWSAPSLPCTLALFTPCNQETQPRKHRGEGGELATQDTSDGDRFLDHLRHIFHGKTTSAVFQAQRHSPVAVWTETREGKWGQRFGGSELSGRREEFYSYKRKSLYQFNHCVCGPEGGR